MKTNKKAIAAAQRRIDAFNERCPVGGMVYVKLDGKYELFKTTTKSPAEILSGHSPVVWLDGVRGCYHLDAIQPL